MPKPENILGQGFHTNPERINREGRPKGVENSKTRLLRLLSLVQKKKNPVTGETEEFTVLEQMDMQIIAKALKGDQKAYKEIMDRLEGSPNQKIEQKTEHTGEQKVIFEIIETTSQQTIQKESDSI